MAITDQSSQKTLDYYLSLPYPIILVPDPAENTWYVTIPLLEGCMTDGETIEEALENLKEAQTLWLEVSLERGHDIPEPENPVDYVLSIGRKKSK